MPAMRQCRNLPDGAVIQLDRIAPPDGLPRRGEPAVHEGGDDVDEGFDLGLGELGLFVGLGGVEGALDGEAFGADVGDPLTDDGGPGAGFEGGSVPGEAAVAVLAL